MADMMVFVDSDCEGDEEMARVLKKIRKRLNRLNTNVTKEKPDESSDPSVRERKLNSRLKRLIRAKKRRMSECELLPKQKEPKPSTSRNEESDNSSIDSGLDSVANCDGRSKVLAANCDNCDKNTDRKQRKRKSSPSNQSCCIEEKIRQRKIVALDCEFVGVGIKKTSALGRCSIVDYDGNILLDVYSRPNEPITDYRTPWSGLRKRDFANSIPFENAVSQVKRMIAGKIVVGHAVNNDFRVLGISHSNHLIRDTQKCKQLKTWCLEKGGNGCSLKTYTKFILNRDIQKGEHCSVEDSKATMELYRFAQKEFEDQIKDQGQPDAKRKRLDSEDPNSSYLDDKFWPDTVNE